MQNLSHCPYKPDFELCDFSLLLMLKEKFAGRKLNTDSEIIIAVPDSFKQLPKKVFHTFLKHRLNDGTVADHLTENILKNNYFFYKYIY